MGDYSLGACPRDGNWARPCKKLRWEHSKSSHLHLDILGMLQCYIASRRYSTQKWDRSFGR